MPYCFEESVQLTTLLIATVIRALIEMGVVVTTGSGNRLNAPVDGIPARYKDPTDRNHIEDLIVVGSTVSYSRRAPQSQTADYVDIYAPGYGVSCTDPQRGSTFYRDTARGTSICEYSLYLPCETPEHSWL